MEPVILPEPSENWQAGAAADILASMPGRVVVTGASGHLGYHVARVLLEAGYPVDLLLRRVNPNVADLVRRGARHHLVDFQDPSTYAPALKDAACLFHGAAENTMDTRSADRVLSSTLGLTRTLLTAAADAGVKTVVYTSSVVVLGRSRDPKRLLSEADRTAVRESPYVQGKAEADAFCEQLIQSRGLDIRRMYPSWIVGPDDPKGTPPHKIVGDFLRKGQRLYFDGGISIADVEQVALAHVAAWERGEPRGAYVLAGDNVRFEELFSILAELTGKARPSVRLPRWFVVTAAALLKIGLRPLGKAPPMDPGYARTVVGSYSWYDSGKAVRELGYRIPPARESLRKAVLGERKRMARTHELGKPRSWAAPTPSNGEMPPLLITGVPGWLGNNFVDRFINGDPQGLLPPRRRIRLLVERRNADLLGGLPPDFEVCVGDIGDPEAVFKALEGVVTVFHLAGAIYPPRIETLYKVNAEGTRTLVDACIRRGVRRVLYMGTDAICGHGSPDKRLFDERTPDNPYRHYGRSKWLGERYVLEKTAQGLIDGTSLRGFWFFGPFAPDRQQGFLDMMRWKRQIVFGNGKNFRSISHTANTVSAFLAAETATKTYGKWYWIGDAKADYTVDEIYGLLCAGAGNAYRPLYVPGVACALARGADTVLGKLGRLHPTVHGVSKFDYDIAGKPEAAVRDFGYAPVISLADYAKRAFE